MLLFLAMGFTQGIWDSLGTAEKKVWCCFGTYLKFTIHWTVQFLLFFQKKSQKLDMVQISRKGFKLYSSDDNALSGEKWVLLISNC